MRKAREKTDIESKGEKTDCIMECNLYWFLWESMDYLDVCNGKDYDNKFNYKKVFKFYSYIFSAFNHIQYVTHKKK